VVKVFYAREIKLCRMVAERKYLGGLPVAEPVLSRVYQVRVETRKTSYTPFHGVDVFVSVCMLLVYLLCVAVCSTSLVCAVRTVFKTLAREHGIPEGGV